MADYVSHLLRKQAFSAQERSGNPNSRTIGTANAQGVGMPLGAFRSGHPLERMVAISGNWPRNLVAGLPTRVVNDNGRYRALFLSRSERPVPSLGREVAKPYKWTLAACSQIAGDDRPSHFLSQSTALWLRGWTLRPSLGCSAGVPPGPGSESFCCAVSGLS
jgi:hypothetical protein